MFSIIEAGMEVSFLLGDGLVRSAIVKSKRHEDSGVELCRMCDLRTQFIEWLWPRRLALGKLALLEGDPGLGKSLLTLDLCARLSRGWPLPDGSGVMEPGNALVLNAEDGDADTVRARLVALGADLARVFVLAGAGMSGVPIRLPSQCPLLDEALTRTKARLVILDPLLAFLDSGVIAGNDQSVRRALTPLAALAAHHNCCVLMVRHLNKRGGRHALYRGGGAIGLLGACRSAWLVGRDPVVAGQCVLAQVKNNLAASQGSLGFRVVAESGAIGLSWLGPSPWSAEQVLAGLSRGAARLQARAFLLSALESGPRLVREIWSEGQRQGLSARTMRRAGQDLSIASQRVEHDGRHENYWLLPGQEVPAEAFGGEDLEAWLGPLREKYPSATPLDEE
jgi:putative DNA primase/helicase